MPRINTDLEKSAEGKCFAINADGWMNIIMDNNMAQKLKMLLKMFWLIS